MVEKAVKKKRNKSYVKWKDCDDSLNSWVDIKRYHYMK